MSSEDGVLIEPVAMAVQIVKVSDLKAGQTVLGEGADVVLEYTDAEPCIQAGVFAAKKGGTYIQASIGNGQKRRIIAAFQQ